MQRDPDSIKKLFPFILPIVSNAGLHYLVVNGIKSNNKLKIYDPAKGSQYYLTFQEIKNKSKYIKSTWDLVPTNQKLTSICSQELENYKLNIYDVLQTADLATLFNKLTYFSYLKENFGFVNHKAEKDFLSDLLRNQEISTIPKHFKTLKYNNEKVKIKAPLVLSVKTKELNSHITLPSSENTNIYWQLFKQLGQYKKLWGIYIFAALFSAITAQLAVFINQILIDDILPSYNLGTLTLFAIGLGIYKFFDLFTSIYKSFVGLHLGNMLDRYFLNSFDDKLNKFSLPYILTYKIGDLI